MTQDTLIRGHAIRPEIKTLIQKDFPHWNDTSYICKIDYEKYRIQYVSKLIMEDGHQVEKLKLDIIENIKNSEFLSSNLNQDYEKTYKFSEKLADRVAKFGGSWNFISIFFLLLFFWILTNTHFLLTKPFDPYPFILMNLILSCIAAIQAPVIMMSQNRQEAKDRIRAENDYKINLKAEVEIRTLHEKVDHLLLEQWSKMIEVQQLQLELLNEIRENVIR